MSGRFQRHPKLLLWIRILWIAVSVAWIFFIFYQSTQNATESSKASNGVLASVNMLFCKMGLPFEFTSYAIRKLAHFTEYTILSIILSFGMMLFPCFLSKKYILPLCAATIAILDEGIQSFSPGRSPQIMDVGIDCCGILVGFSLCLFIFSITQKKKQVS